MADTQSVQVRELRPYMRWSVVVRSSANARSTSEVEDEPRLRRSFAVRRVFLRLVLAARLDGKPKTAYKKRDKCQMQMERVFCLLFFFCNHKIVLQLSYTCIIYSKYTAYIRVLRNVGVS